MSNLRCRFNEKRDFIRMKIDADAYITVDSGKTSLNGVCRNLSGGGMLIEMKTALPIGTKLNVTVKSSYGHTPTLKAKTTIARIDHKTPDKPYSMGLKVNEVIS